MRERAGLALAIVAFATTVARAQPYDDPETEAALRALDPPDPVTEQEPARTDTRTESAPPVLAPRAPGIALPRGRVTMTLTVEAALSSGAAFEPTSIAPDVSYGATDRLTLSIVHSGFATTGFRGSAGGGFCVTGADRGCAKIYNNAGGEALVDVVRGKLAVAVVGGVHALAFDTSFFAVKLGAQASYRDGNVTATVSPSVLVGVTEREAGNKGGGFLPVSIGAQVATPLFLAIGGGVAAPLDGASERWTARLGLIARYRVARSTTVAASMFLPQLAGGDAVSDTGTERRTANVWITYTR
ncbi:MAG: hypothetical protein H0T89_19800 [Deltaproteobacteria bacterium]|nr:hypothetical protein [Deltaproteobacteria bacterium]MDQ3295751.1 hypothetical protein [Myxococcota bacterium]